MFSQEQFDFPSTGHPADAHLDALDPYHDALFDSYIDSSYVDQSFCSDFVCCGQKLPDLHRLLEHFEDEHVLPLGADARPLFSSPVYAQPRSAALAPYASYILSYPQPDPPFQAATHSMFGPGARAPLPSLQFAAGIAVPPVPDLAHPHPPLSPSPTASSATSAQSSPGPAEPICLPPALFSVQPSLTSRSRSRRDRPRGLDASDTDVDVDVDMDADMDETDEEARAGGADARPAPGSKLPSLGTGNATGGGGHRRARQKTKKKKKMMMMKTTANANAKGCSAARTDAVSVSVRRAAERAGSTMPPPPKRRDGREKAFRCPHPGCTKSYLNPNGLKYHLEKGTCTNADVRGRDPSPVSGPALAALPCPVRPTAVGAAATETAAEASSDSGLAAAVVVVVAEDGDPARLEAGEGEVGVVRKAC